MASSHEDSLFFYFFTKVLRTQQWDESFPSAEENFICGVQSVTQLQIYLEKDSPEEQENIRWECLYPK